MKNFHRRALQRKAGWELFGVENCYAQIIFLKMVFVIACLYNYLHPLKHV